MNYLRRLAYFGYYLRRLDWLLLARFMDHVEQAKGWSRMGQWRRVFRDSLQFNISILEYYQFRFFELSDLEKAEWAGTGSMYEFQLRANPRISRNILEDKRTFYHAYADLFIHELYSLEDIRSDADLATRLLSNNDRIVLKEATGNCGKGVKIVPCASLSCEGLVSRMEAEELHVAEAFIRQHPDLNGLSPSAVNTVRVFTQIRSSGEYEVLGCRLRISIDSPIDNLAAGNMAAPIDRETGIVNGPGVFSDITREPCQRHPISGCPIVGFRIPFWTELLAMVQRASLLHPENRSVGWDVVITEDGPGLIEGNHDWCKLVWQLPVGRGLKHRLESNF